MHRVINRPITKVCEPATSRPKLERNVSTPIVSAPWNFRTVEFTHGRVSAPRVSAPCVSAPCEIPHREAPCRGVSARRSLSTARFRTVRFRTARSSTERFCTVWISAPFLKVYLRYTLTNMLLAYSRMVRISPVRKRSVLKFHTTVLQRSVVWKRGNINQLNIVSLAPPPLMPKLFTWRFVWPTRNDLMNI